MFVTGGAGFLGRHVVRFATAVGWDVVAPPSSSMDITDRSATMATIARANADVIVHLAYRKDDRQVIVDGTRHVAEAAAAAHTRLIHMSTDVVFGGRPTAYGEADEPDPVIDYGQDKADAECAAAAAMPDAAIIRTSLLYGTADPSPFQIDLAAGSGPERHR